MKTAERYQAIELRKNGLTYTQIGQRLGVSKGTLSSWLQRIPYETAEETKQKRRLASINNGRLLHKRKIKRVEQIKLKASREITKIEFNELKLLGIMAYWAEGSKTQDGLIKFTNSDQNFIKFVLKWLRHVCHVPEDKFRLHIRIHQDLDKDKVEKYWLGVTRISRKRLFKTTIKKSSSKGKRYNKLDNGIASIVVCDTALFYKIMGWIESLTEKFKL